MIMSDELLANGYLAACSSEAWRSSWSRGAVKGGDVSMRHATMRRDGRYYLKVACICNGAWRESVWVSIG